MELGPTEENANHGVELEGYTTDYATHSLSGNLPSINEDSHSQHFRVFFL